MLPEGRDRPDDLEAACRQQDCSRETEGVLQGVSDAGASKRTRVTFLRIAGRLRPSCARAGADLAKVHGEARSAACS